MQLGGLTNLNDTPKIHHDYAIGDMTHDAQIMANK